MFDLVYYYVPTEYICYDKKLKHTINMDIINWDEIDIADTLKEERKMKFRERISNTHFFIDEPVRVAQLFWDIKGGSEIMVIKKRESRLLNKYVEKEIKNQEELEEELNKVIFNNYYHAFLYFNENELMKVIYINEAEIINLFFNRTQKKVLENVIKKWARKVDYYSFQHDFEDFD